MSIIGSAKEFFGLGPFNEDDPYFDEVQYDERENTREESTRPSRTSEYGSEDRYRSSVTRDYADRAPKSYTPQVVSTAPRNYNDAKDIGEPFRDGDAVIMELTDLDPHDAKRIVDFAAGLCFALRGNMYNLSRGVETRRRVFAIVPENARLTEVELQHTARLR